MLDEELPMKDQLLDLVLEIRQMDEINLIAEPVTFMWAYEEEPNIGFELKVWDMSALILTLTPETTAH